MDKKSVSEMTIEEIAKAHADYDYDLQAEKIKDLMDEVSRKIKEQMDEVSRLNEAQLAMVLAEYQRNLDSGALAARKSMVSQARHYQEQYHDYLSDLRKMVDETEESAARRVSELWRLYGELSVDECASAEEQVR